MTERELWAYGVENDLCEFWRICGIASSRDVAIERAAEMWRMGWGENTLVWIAPFGIDAPPVRSEPERSEYWSADAGAPR